MLVVNSGENIEIPFIYKIGFTYSDPSEDIIIYLRRGHGGQGPIIMGPYKYAINLIEAATPVYLQEFTDNVSLERISEGSFVLNLTIPSNIYEGPYTVQISTVIDGAPNLKEYYVQVPKQIQQNTEVYSPVDKNITVNVSAQYENTSQSETNTIILIGHTDAFEPFSIKRVFSVQDAINILRADFQSPLLRGFFDAYAAGARNIYLMSAGTMSEYVEDVNLRNQKVFADDSATPNEFGNQYSFYELYYMKLEICYSILKEYEFIDMIVPLETSMIDTGDVNFVSQLSDHCENVQRQTGEVQLGIIGSRSIQGTNQNIQDLAEKDFEIFSDVTSDGLINADAGKYIILIYGEAVFDHDQIQRSYAGSVAASFAGTLASTRVDYGLARKRIPVVLSISGNGLTTSQMRILNEKKINYILDGKRSRRGNPFDICISGDLTQSISENYSDASNVRLVAMIIAEVQSLGRNAIGKFSYDRVIRNVDALLSSLKLADIIRDYKFDAYADRLIKGKLYFNISIVSVRTLRTISFNVATGRGM